jgi:tetratricopeptide (TPR) repeat protein
MFRSIVLLVGGLASLSTVSLLAQDAVLGQEYGAGVHAFFTGDYVKAYEQLSAAIEGGSKDPRAFYFRGLACLQLGRGPDAAIDFRKGAELESADVNRFYDVGKALERVQGSARGSLEDYRVAARMAALETAEKLRKARYEAIEREESRVLREQALTAPPPGVEVVPPPAAAAEEADPFATPKDLPAVEPAKKAGKAPKKPAAKAAAAEEDPFGAKADAAPKAAPKSKVTPPKAGTPKPPTKKPAASDDPFAS